MARRHKLVIAAVAVLSVLVASAAVAATRAFSPRQEQQAIIDDAAQQLGVEPQELSDALKQALKNRVDAAVADGRLTQEEGARLKERIDAGDTPFFGLGPGPRFGPGPGFPEHRDHALFPGKFEAAARYLGMTQARLRDALQDGKTLAQVARERGKSVDGLVDALLVPAEQKLEQAVENGELTEAEKREMLSGLRERITDIVNGRFPLPFDRGYGFDHQRHHVPFAGKFEAAARYLGMTQAQLRDVLQDGKTLAQVARDQGKSVDGLVDALVAEAEKKLDLAVDEGHLTEAEKRETLSGLRERITDLVNGRFPPRLHRRPDRGEFRGERPAIF
jgi:outer membrane murein-binding lipoprotein Lpp